MSEQWIWRLTLECGHLRLSGPWDSPHKDDGSPRHMVGDLSICELCPRVDLPGPPCPTFAVRYVLDVTPVPEALYRQPDDVGMRERQRQLYGG